LPPLDFPEALEVTRILSVLGQSVGDRLAEHRPFRAPHHTISYAGLVGGGTRVQPGEVTRAHRGVLFLDELPEFQRRTLEALREPLEEGVITITRGSGSRTFPARFLLVAAMNPCPCGYLGHPKRACTCSPLEVRTYAQRISGPLLDRLDIFVPVSTVRATDLLSPPCAPSGECSRDLRERVLEARRLQARRWGHPDSNSRVTLPRLLAEGDFRPPAIEKLRGAADRWGISARGFARCLRVARTVADLDGERFVDARHLGEALHFRLPPS
jgi:magnesium chelatase family protein